MAVKIIGDNCCDLPGDILKNDDVKLIHMLVRFGVKEFLPEDLNLDEFYREMVKNPELPTTSQPLIEEMIRIYSDALADGSEVIAIHLSSGITGTVNSARMVREDLPGKERLHIVDSMKASVGQGLMILEAARMATAGSGVKEILARIEEMQRTVECIFTLDTIEYLVKGGRISRAAGLVASVLDIKPILRFDEEGYIVSYDKVRGRKAATKRLISLMGEQKEYLADQTVGINHSACPRDAQMLYDIIEKEFKPKEIVVGQIGPVIGSHVGPGTVSVFFENRGGRK